jgi:hypothetical protein
MTNFKFKLKSIDKELDEAKTRIGLQFNDSREPFPFIRELVIVYREESRIYYKDQKGSRWTPDFIEKELLDGGCLTEVES